MNPFFRSSGDPASPHRGRRRAFIVLLALSSIVCLVRLSLPSQAEKTDALAVAESLPPVRGSTEEASAAAVPAAARSDGLDQYEFYEAESVRILRGVDHLRKPGSRERLVAQLADLKQRQEAAVAARAVELGVPLQRSLAGGGVGALIGFEGNRPIYVSEENADAAVSTGASYVRQNASFDATFGPGVDGSGFGAGVFELGSVYQHEEFALEGGGSRVVVLTTAATTEHAAHVAGTIGAQGLVAAAKGMAPAVTLYNWYQESAEKYASRAIAHPGEADRMVVTNTSLGSSGTGRYTAADQARDEWARLFPYTIMFQCAGNSGSAYETLNASSKEAKNHFTVGRVSDVQRNAAGAITGGGVIASSSSRGPTDDGRIKPDIVANGTSVYSTINASNAYESKSGTSMSTPNATGSAILLQDYFSKRFPGHLLRSDTLKGLIIHTADDGGNAGPDYIYGYGIMNVHAGAGIIKDYADNPATRRLIHTTLPGSGVHTYAFTWNGTDPIRVTLAWLDPAGPVSAYDDDRTPALVNDLDVTVTSPLGTVHRPWVMPYVLNGFDPNDRGTPAVKGDNTVDNAELVLIETPAEAGVYTVTVTHKGALQGGEQAYSLIHSGFAAPASAPAPVVTGWTDLGDGWIEIAGENFLLGAEVTRAYGDTLAIPGEHLQVSGTRIVCKLASAPYAEGELVVTNPDGQAAGVALTLPATGGVVLTAYEASWTYTQTFDSLTSNVTTPETWIDDAPADTTNGLKGWYAGYYMADGTLKPGGAEIRGSNGTTDYARLYSFGASSSATDRAFGNFRKDDVIQYGGSIRQGLRLVNRTGQTLTGFHLQFRGEQWRNGGNSIVNTMDVGYAVFAPGEGTLLDGATPYTALTSFTAPVNGGSVTSLNGNAAENSATVTAELDGIVWPPGEELWLRWKTINHPYVDDGLAMDDLVFTAWPAATP